MNSLRRLKVFWTQRLLSKYQDVLLASTWFSFSCYLILRKIWVWFKPSNNTVYLFISHFHLNLFSSNSSPTHPFLPGSPKCVFILWGQPWMRNACAWVSRGGPEDPAVSLPLALLCECLSNLIYRFVLMAYNTPLTSWCLILNLRFIRVFECILFL